MVPINLVLELAKELEIIASNVQGFESRNGG